MDETEELELIEQYYRKTVAWAPSDEEALAIAQDLLEKAQRGFVVDDTGDGLLYASDPELPVDAEFLVDEGALNQERLRRGLVIVGAFLIALLGLLLVYGGDSGSTPTATPVATTRVPLFLVTQTPTPIPTSSPTPTPAPTQTPSPTPIPTQTPTPLPPEEVEVKPEPVKLEEGAVVPVSLEIAGRYFPIVPTGLRDEHWAYVTEPDQAGTERGERISWLVGSYVNLLLGLPYTQHNLDLLASSLTISDTVTATNTLTANGVSATNNFLTVRNSVGGINHYRVVERYLVDVYAIEVLGQRRAGLTLVLLGGNEENPDRRLVIWAVPTEFGEEVAKP
jgi:hypothetical protein